MCLSRHNALLSVGLNPAILQTIEISSSALPGASFAGRPEKTFRYQNSEYVNRSGLFEDSSALLYFVRAVMSEPCLL